jgi:hypothetical protein
MSDAVKPPKPRKEPTKDWVGPTVLRQAWITDGQNDLGLRDSEDEPIVLPSPSPGARTDRIVGRTS